MKRFFTALVFVFVLASVLSAADAPAQSYAPDADGFIRNWLVLNPIPLPDSANTQDEDAQKEFFYKEYFPNQRQATPKAGDTVTIDGQPSTWQVREAASYDLPFALDGNSIPCSVSLGLVYIVCDQDIPNVRLAIGSDDGSRWTLDDQELIRVYEARGIDKDQNLSPRLTLKRGTHILRLLVINGGNPSSACARFLDQNNRPIRNFTVTLTPPK